MGSLLSFLPARRLCRYIFLGLLPWGKPHDVLARTPRREWRETLQRLPVVGWRSCVLTRLRDCRNRRDRLDTLVPHPGNHLCRAVEKLLNRRHGRMLLRSGPPMEPRFGGSFRRKKGTEHLGLSVPRSSFAGGLNFRDERQPPAIQRRHPQPPSRLMLNRAVTIVFLGPFAENVFLSLSATGSHVSFQFGDGTRRP